jgi:predicted CXXCH cytochrome family protein
MKKILALGLAGLASLVVGAGIAFADGGIHVPAEFMVDAPTACAACHRPHRGQDDMLLKLQQVDLCFSCHDGTSSSLNVKNGVYGSDGGLRGGGFVNAKMDTNGDAVLEANMSGPTTSTHSVDGSAQTVWGGGLPSSGLGTADVELSCANCHNPHTQQSGTVAATDVSGTLVGTYRMLRPRPEGGYNNGGGTLIDYGNGTVPPTPINPADPAYSWNPPAGWNAVSLPDDTTDTYTYTYTLKNTAGGFGIPARAGQYKDVAYTNGAGWVGDSWTTTSSSGSLRSYTRSKLSLWCGLCHTRYVTDREVGTWYNNPYPDATNPDPVFTYRHSSDLVGRNCFNCHVVHGSSANMIGYAADVELPKLAADPDVIPDDANNSRLLQIDGRGMCYACHSYKSLSQP